MLCAPAALCAPPKAAKNKLRPKQNERICPAFLLVAYLPKIQLKCKCIRPKGEGAKVVADVRAPFRSSGPQSMETDASQAEAGESAGGVRSGPGAGPSIGVNLGPLLNPLFLIRLVLWAPLPSPPLSPPSLAEARPRAALCTSALQTHHRKSSASQQTCDGLKTDVAPPYYRRTFLNTHTHTRSLRAPRIQASSPLGYWTCGRSGLSSELEEHTSLWVQSNVWILRL